MERIGTFCEKCRMPSCICNNEFNKEAIIKWIARRIKDEQRKHEKNIENWQELAARKLYATYNITFKPDIDEDECDYCSNFKCNGGCDKDL